MKICTSCGGKLLDKAIRCPYCNAKDKNSTFPIFDRTDKEEMQKTIAEIKAKKINYKVANPHYLNHSKPKNPSTPKNNAACCPKCGSTSIIGNKKGFGVGKAFIGGMLIGGVGLLAGTLGQRKVIVTCLNCGHQYKAGKR